jgi:hypothetical protein
MLIINILLILLFFIILLYEVNIIEGQEEILANQEIPDNQETDNNQDNNDFYNYSNLLSDYHNILSKIDISKYLGFDIKNFMKKYNSRCSDTDELIEDKLLNSKLEKNLNINMETDIITVENNVNNILGYFNIQIENEDELSINNDNLNNNDDNIPKLCSLVNTIYDKNNNLSPLLTSDILNKYGGCFTTEGENKFRNDCKQSCHLQEETLETCSEFTVEDLKNCSEYPKIPSHQNNPIHIKKNGLYYNCSLVLDNNTLKSTYIEKPCIPKNNTCNEKPIGAGKTCENFNASMEGDCEDYYMYIRENNTYLNCIKDRDYNCKKNIKEYYNKPCLNKDINIVNYDYCKFNY